MRGTATFRRCLHCCVDNEPSVIGPAIGMAWGVEGRAPLFLAGIGNGGTLAGGAVLNQDRAFGNRCAVNPPIIVSIRRTHERNTRHFGIR